MKYLGGEVGTRSKNGVFMNGDCWKMIGRALLVSLAFCTTANAQNASSPDSAHQDAASSGRTYKARPTQLRRSTLLQPYHPADEADFNSGFLPESSYPMPSILMAPYFGKGGRPATKRQTTLLPSSFDNWLEQDGVFGDPMGWRSYLQDHGVSMGGRYFEDTSVNPIGGRSRGGRYADEFAFNVDIDFKKMTGLSLGMIHFMMTDRHGTGLGNALPVVNSPQEIYGAGQYSHLTQLSWEMRWNKYVDTEVGEINTENDFEQSSIYWGGNLYCQFQNNGLCGMPQSIAMNSGYGFYPSAHPGAWVKFYPAGNDHYLVQFGAYSVDPRITERRRAWNLGLGGATGMFLPFQLGWHQGGKDDYSGPLQTNVKIGGYWDTTEVHDVFSQLKSYGVPAQLAQNVQSPKVRGRFGGWFQFDRMLERDENDPRRSTAFFGSFTWGDPRTAVAPYLMTLGLVRKGTFPGRPDDTISLGGKIIWINPKLSHWVRGMQNSGYKDLYRPGTESALELNYGYRPARWLLIRPGFQYYWRPGATSRYKDVLLFDMEAGITF